MNNDFEIENTAIGKYTLIKYKGDDENVVIPDGVTKIDTAAFYSNTLLQSVTIPDSVTEIGDDAFALCDSLSSINIPDGVTEIGENAFFNCTSLQSITIPDSVTEIGENAFNDCNNLKCVYTSNTYVRKYIKENYPDIKVGYKVNKDNKILQRNYTK